MIKSFFVLMLLPFTLYCTSDSSQDEILNQVVELNIDFSQMLSLTVEHPLGLTDSTHELIYGSLAIEKEKTMYLKWMKNHTFPWIRLLVFIGVGLLFWIIYLFREEIMVIFKSKNNVNQSSKSMSESYKDLKNKKLIESGKIKEFYFELNNLVYDHLTVQIKLPLNTKTTAQVCKLISENDVFDADQKQNFSILLKQFENIKFSNKMPSLNEINKLINKFEILVKK